MLPPDTLELVVPRGTRPADVAAFVRKHTRWIERARSEIAEHYPDGKALPELVDLAAVGTRWPVRYSHDAAARPICRVADATLLVRTRDAERRDAPELLRRWLIEQARFHLRPWLLREAAVVGVAPTHVRVRLQRTRWGSCSSGGGISLNAGLLFLAPELVRYLLIHELSHMLVLNHSRRFWRAVERHEPDWRELDRRLSEAWGVVPIWAHERRGARRQRVRYRVGAKWTRSLSSTRRLLLTAVVYGFVLWIAAHANWIKLGPGWIGLGPGFPDRLHDHAVAVSVLVPRSARSRARPKKHHAARSRVDESRWRGVARAARGAVYAVADDVLADAANHRWPDRGVRSRARAGPRSRHVSGVGRRHGDDAQLGGCAEPHVDRRGDQGAASGLPVAARLVRRRSGSGRARLGVVRRRLRIVDEIIARLGVPRAVRARRLGDSRASRGLRLPRRRRDPRAARRGRPAARDGTRPWIAPTRRSAAASSIRGTTRSNR